MSLENDEVQLTSLQAPSVDFDHVHTAWEFLIQNSVEIITAGFPHVHDFVDNYCLYFFVIQHIVDLEVQEGNGKKLLFTDPAQDEYDRYLETIGILYLSASHIPNTLNVGVALLPEARRFGFGRQATCLAINWAFKELECHRIQAQVVDGDPTLLDISLGLFTGLGFSHEGTLRRALFYPTAPMQLFPPDTSGEWRDVINLAVLDMDWAMWKTYPRISREIMKSRWDDLFSRHEREREAMLRLEEWEEERKLAVAQAGGIDDEARASQATKNENVHPSRAAAFRTQPGGYLGDSIASVIRPQRR
ncbi:hypothetical protein NM688_g4470 [Phlebia brevispora]|uniref:Uncharacterized protein n=1 Tax=Phlebia brevispora TaxID=194682 RepID=A0ACC1T2W8_9APHY|nr:hypothetical protein NM688_g4470 [Phlebia brevispora]